MSQKKYDKHNRFRSKTVSFRMSPEENGLLNTVIALSGLTKQDFIISKVLDLNITVIPNPRIYKNIKEYIQILCCELSKAGKIDYCPDKIDEIDFLTNVLRQMRGARNVFEKENDIC